MLSGSGKISGSRDAVAMSRMRSSPFEIPSAWRQSLVVRNVFGMRRKPVAGVIRRRVSRTYARSTSEFAGVVSLASFWMSGQCVEW